MFIEGAGRRVEVTHGEVLRDVCELDDEREDSVVLSATCGCLLGYTLTTDKEQSIFDHVFAVYYNI